MSCYSRPHSSIPFRLLRIKPGAYGQPLCCYLVKTDLASCPNYLALSYSWHEPRSESVLWQRFSSTVDGSDWPSIEIQLPELWNFIGTLAIPFSLSYEAAGRLTTNLNLNAALRRIRAWFNEPVYIWVDQICINQSDE